MAKKKTTTKKSAADGTSSAAGYTVLARRYRSRDFGEVVGQEPIARTLQSAIQQGRTAHAYLFCGTRGVGKTSMARIFAKALNADAAQTQGAAIAEAVLRGEDLDVIEIDGASNRGINEARDLIAGAGLSPTRGKYKIYIIDEVHMLTREAFNALLKTMEEPPPHVKFILCTTDPQKVPATIQSRCQRFDFRAIPTVRIAEHLTAVLEQEQITADEDVVLTVASLGNGSMRDALSLLDRLLAAGQTGLTMEQARDILGLPATEVIDQLVQAVIDSDPAAGLAAGAELIAGGATVETALEMFIDRFRTLMLIAACGPGTELLDLTREARERAAAQAANFDAAGLVYMIATCDAVARNARGSATGRALFDAAIVRVCLGQRFGDVAAMVAGGAGATPAEKKKPELTAGRPSPVIEAARGAPALTSAPPPSARPNGTASRAAAPPPPPPPTPATASAPAPAASPASAPPAPAPDLETAWRRLLATAEGPIAAVAASVKPVSMQDRMVTLVPLGPTPGGSLGFLERRAEGLAGPLGTLLGHTVRVRIDVTGTAASEDASAGAGANGPAASGSSSGSASAAGSSGGRGGGLRTSSIPDASSADEAVQLPLVRTAMEIFDASIAEVRDLPPPPPTI